MNKPKELYINRPKPREPRDIWQVQRALAILRYLRIPIILTNNVSDWRFLDEDPD